MTVRDAGLVLHGFYRMRGAPYYTPRLGDFGHSVSFEDIFAACEDLARHGLLEWMTIPGVSAASFGSGRITPLGVEVLEGRASCPLALHLPLSLGPASLGMGAMPDISRQLHDIADALEHCTGQEDDLAEARRRLARLVEHPLVAAMGRVGTRSRPEFRGA